MMISLRQWSMLGAAIIVTPDLDNWFYRIFGVVIRLQAQIDTVTPHDFGVASQPVPRGLQKGSSTAFT